jgi:hypothetical protein
MAFSSIRRNDVEKKSLSFDDIEAQSALELPTGK